MWERGQHPRAIEKDSDRRRIDKIATWEGRGTRVPKQAAATILNILVTMAFAAITRLLACLLVAESAAYALPVGPRAVIAHDAVVGFTEAVPSGLTGQLYLKYKPFLKVSNGCVPFPAVDASGNTR
jgi:hypothetical protein